MYVYMCAYMRVCVCGRQGTPKTKKHEQFKKAN